MEETKKNITQKFDTELEDSDAKQSFSVHAPKPAEGRVVGARGSKPVGDALKGSVSFKVHGERGKSFRGPSVAKAYEGVVKSKVGKGGPVASKVHQSDLSDAVVVPTQLRKEKRSNAVFLDSTAENEFLIKYFFGITPTELQDAEGAKKALYTMVVGLIPQEWRHIYNECLRYAFYAGKSLDEKMQSCEAIRVRTIVESVERDYRDAIQNLRSSSVADLGLLGTTSTFRTLAALGNSFFPDFVAENPSIRTKPHNKIFREYKSVLA